MEIPAAAEDTNAEIPVANLAIPFPQGEPLVMVIDEGSAMAQGGTGMVAGVEATTITETSHALVID
jgi:hypothetical protein